MPGVARQNDAGVTHCSGFKIVSGSGDVFVNGRPCARVNDSSSPHLKPGGKSCVTHSAKISAGSGSVFVNGRPVARQGDPFGGCTKIQSASGDVHAG